MSQTRTGSKFRAAEPITSRPEPRIAAQTEQRRSVRTVQGRGMSRPGAGTVAVFVIALIGLGIAAYTTVVHYVGPSALLCTAAHHGQSSCEQVQFSRWNNVAGIPVSVLGLVGYAVLLATLFVPRHLGEYARALAFGTALIGFLFSLYLTYREAFTLHEYCEWCLTSAGAMTLLVILTGVRFLRTPPAV